MKNSSKLVAALGIIVALVVGFFGGMEYKAYQVRSAIQQALSQINNPASSPTSNPSNQSQNTPATSTQSFIDEPIGQDVALQTLSFKVISSIEQSYLQSSFGSPTGADAGAKFVVVTLSVTNLTNANFTLPFNAFVLLDSQGRAFQPYQNTIGSVDDYLAETQLAPGIAKQGVFVYELPLDSTSYSLVVGKGGSDALYRVKLQ